MSDASPVGLDPASMSVAGSRSVPGIRVAFLSGDPGSASERVRVLDLIGPLASHGVAGEVVPWPRGFFARRACLAQLASADVVVLGRRLLGEGHLAALRRSARALVLDLDDALWARPFGASAWRQRGRFADALRAADVVVAGSAHLRREVRARHPRVRLLPPSVPLPARVGPAATELPAPGAPTRLVWTGSRATLPYLESLAPSLATLARRVPLTLEVVADVPARALPGLPVVHTPWSLEAEARALDRADVGLYPLAHDAWSLGKCAYKVRLYMLHGLPTVASRAGGGLEVLEPPEAGLVADDEGEWLLALETLARDPALRRTMGRRARALALGRDAHEDRARSLARVLHEAAAIGRARG